MRQSFDQSVSLIEQWTRRANFKKPGRKHQKRPGIKASAKQKAHLKRSLAEKNRVHRMYKEQVTLYWNGGLDEFPENP